MSKVLALEKSRQVSQAAVPLVRTPILAPVFLVAIIRNYAGDHVREFVTKVMSGGG